MEKWLYFKGNNNCFIYDYIFLIFFDYLDIIHLKIINVLLNKEKLIIILKLFKNKFINNFFKLFFK